MHCIYFSLLHEHKPALPSVLCYQADQVVCCTTSVLDNGILLGTYGCARLLEVCTCILELRRHLEQPLLVFALPLWRCVYACGHLFESSAAEAH
jgi:hypothetical protein